MISEKQVEIAHKMYESRRLALTLLGAEKFKAKVEEYRPIIQGLMDKWQCNEINATTHIIKSLIAGGHDGMAVMLALAACVEIMEPSHEN